MFETPRRRVKFKWNLPLYKIVEPLVASSGECGGGLGAVVPAVGDDGPQQDVGTAVTALVLLAPLCVPIVCESPTTSISSSSSMVCVAAVVVAVELGAPPQFTMTIDSNDTGPFDGDGGDDVVVVDEDDEDDDADDVAITVAGAFAVTVVTMDDVVDAGSTVSIVVCVESSERSCHGYAFHFFAIKQRGIVQQSRRETKITNCLRRFVLASAFLFFSLNFSSFGFGKQITQEKNWIFFFSLNTFICTKRRVLQKN